MPRTTGRQSRSVVSNEDRNTGVVNISQVTIINGGGINLNSMPSESGHAISQTAISVICGSCGGVSPDQTPRQRSGTDANDANWGIVELTSLGRNPFSRHLGKKLKWGREKHTSPPIVLYA
ncbi:hypothetical protein PCL_11608 [Purpureocillium lilacinum]|uniref:Uncharacterized protein n=1 Tax=Purpureocillium lilacinum TaxID=33203 RepID=A0A2U3EAH9_PURLI|nr:hypothetical protein PCL_11608 [Purpureocillium lilacinum]